MPKKWGSNAAYNAPTVIIVHCFPEIKISDMDQPLLAPKNGIENSCMTIFINQMMSYERRTEPKPRGRRLKADQKAIFDAFAHCLNVRRREDTARSNDILSSYKEYVEQTTHLNSNC